MRIGECPFILVIDPGLAGAMQQFCKATWKIVVSNSVYDAKADRGNCTEEQDRPKTEVSIMLDRFGRCDMIASSAQD